MSELKNNPETYSPKDEAIKIAELLGVNSPDAVSYLVGKLEIAYTLGEMSSLKRVTEDGKKLVNGLKVI